MRRMAAVVCMMVIVGIARADNQANPNGTWKYTADVNGQSIVVTIKLKQKGEKLTGTVTALDMAMKIKDGQYRNGKVSFKVSSEVNGNKFAITYHGVVQGDTIKGKREVETNGQTVTRAFVAKRSKE